MCQYEQEEESERDCLLVSTELTIIIQKVLNKLLKCPIISVGIHNARMMVKGYEHVLRVLCHVNHLERQIFIVLHEHSRQTLQSILCRPSLNIRIHIN